MAEFEIRGKITADTSDFQRKIDDINDITKQTQAQPLYSQSSSPLELQQINEETNSDPLKKVNYIIQEFGNTVDNSLQQISSKIKDSTNFKQTDKNVNSIINDTPNSDREMLISEFDKSLPNIVYNFKQLAKSLEDFKQEVPAAKKTLNQEERNQRLIEKYKEQNLIGFFNNGNALTANILSGNVGGATSGFLTNTAQSLERTQRIAENTGNDKLLDFLGKVIPGLMIGGAVVKGASMFSDKYSSAENGINATGRTFNFDADEDLSFSNYKRVNDYNIGTGLNNADFNNYVRELAKQGVVDLDSAASNTQSVTKWAYATNGDANQYLDLAGKMMRYGGEKNIGENFSYLYGATKASGLQDSQMGEFLRGIESVMEDGIAKGFTRSSKEVADTMVMFSKLSNGDKFWEGERGAQRINQINNGIASATALAKTSDVIVMQAFASAFDTQAQKNILQNDFIDNGGYLNDMMLMERGLNGEVFGSLMKTLNDRTGGNIQAKAELLKDMTGMNYTGVSKLLALEGKELSKSDLQKEIEKLQKDPKNQNLETRNVEAMNRLSEAAEEMGKGVKGLSTAALEPISKSVDAIKNFLLKDDPTLGMNTIQKEFVQDNEFVVEDTLENRKKIEAYNGFNNKELGLENYLIDKRKKVSGVDTTILHKKIKNEEQAFDFYRYQYGEDILGMLGNNDSDITLFYDYLKEAISKNKKTLLDNAKDITKNKSVIDVEKTDKNGNKYWEGENSKSIKLLQELVDMFKNGIELK